MKKCTRCGIIRPHADFHRRTASKDGLDFRCKPCKSAIKAADYRKSADKVKARVAEYRRQNPEKVSAAKKAAYRKKPEYYRKKHREYYEENRGRALEYSAEYRAKNIERIQQRDQAYKEENRERLNALQRRYQRVNKDRLNKYQRRYRKERMRSDPVYALEQTCRRRLLIAFAKAGFSKKSPTKEMLGCNFEELKAHLESQFRDGMTWGNRGEWHIDHIIPLASAKTEAELLRLFHYTNLQPLWAEENLAKGAKMPEAA